MKIRKLLTLSQFVDLINDKIIAEGEERFTTTRLDQIRDYNNFLKQPLSKEMFVNPYGQPEKEPKGFLRSREAGEKLWEQWQEAEKKVLFEDCVFKIIKNSTLGNSSKWYYFNKYRYSLQTNTLETMCDKHGRYTYFENIKTLHVLAEATKGELTLKNVEL